MPDEATKDVVSRVGGDGPDAKARAAEAEQHPALHGDPEAEVASRSADGSNGMRFRKVFLLGTRIDRDHPCHADNARGVLEEAIQRGLHPKGEAVLVDVKHTEPGRRGQVSTECAYEVEVQPAVTDTDAEHTVTPTRVKEGDAGGWETKQGDTSGPADVPKQGRHEAPSEAE